MEDEAERVLIALADPIRWVPHLYTNNLLSRTWGHWQGQAERAAYRIVLSSFAPHVDLSPVQQSCRLEIQIHEDTTEIQSYVPTVEQAKALCLSHALTGDLTEIQSTNHQIQVWNRLFVNWERDALAQLNAALNRQPPRWLSWSPDDPTVLEFSTTTPRGTYTARFAPDKRWVVTLTHPDRTTEQHCIIMGAIAKMGCSLHAQTGQWLSAFRKSSA